MLKVVLADDEKKILLLLQKLIDWERLGYEIVGTANDGLRALELVLAIYQSAASGKPVSLPLAQCASTDFTGRFDR